MTIRNYYSDLLFNYSIARATEQIDPGLQTGLGEPKFNLGYVAAVTDLKRITNQPCSTPRKTEAPHA